MEINSHSLRTIFTQELDPFTISTELRNHGIISKSQYDQILILFENDASREDIWKLLLYCVGNKYNVIDIVRILEHCGYNSAALKLFAQHILANSVSNGVQRATSEFPGRRNAQKLFINLKSHTHNNSFHNPRHFLRSLSCKFKRKFENEKDEFQRLRAADKYAAVLCAEIDSHTMLYIKELPKHGLFDELRCIIPHTSNSHVTDVAYNARVGIAHAIAEDLDNADGHLRNARMSSHNITQCVEMDNMFYIQVFNLLCEYEKNPTSYIKKNILEVANSGLHCLENDEDDIRLFWQRMFFLRMIYCYLGLSNKGDPIPGVIVTAVCLRKSKQLLGEIDKNWNGMEARRRMFYYAGRARVNELEGNIVPAVTYLNKSIAIGKDGNFGELPYITSYANKLKETQCYLETHMSSFSMPPMEINIIAQEQSIADQTCAKFV